MDRDNAPGAANQQERLDAYLAGFVDGEGSFQLDGSRRTIVVHATPRWSSWSADGAICSIA
jgi:hypothetical protein